MIPPSSRGELEARRQVALFVRELLDEASRVAKRNASEEASAEHVERASNHLFASGASRANQGLSSVGGVIAGFGLSSLVTFLTVHPVNVLGSSVSAAGSILGAVLMTVGLVRRS